MVCVKRWLVPGSLVPAHKPSLHTNHPFTKNQPFKQTIPSHKPTLHTNQPFTQTFPSHKPSLYTNHPFTPTILSHKPTFHTNHPCLYYILPGLCKGMNSVTCIHPFTQTIYHHTVHAFTQTRQYVIQKMMNGLCEGKVCVKGCNVENDKWFVWLSGLCEGLDVSGLCEVTQTRQYVIPSHKPDNM